MVEGLSSEAVAVADPPRRVQRTRAARPPAQGLSIDPKDENLLGWYFTDGQHAAQRSSFGAALARAALFARWLVPCETCGGDGFTTDDGTCGECLGFGAMRAKSKTVFAQSLDDLEIEPIFTTQLCRTCHGTGGGDGLEDDCKRCGGDGYIVPLTVIPGPSNDFQVHEPDLSDIERFGEAHRIWTEVRERDAMAAAALAMYYGSSGTRWAGTALGRVFALWPFTKPGAALAQASLNRSANPGTKTAQELLAEEHQLQAAEPKEARGLLLEGADADARRLYDRAKRVWCAAAREVRGHRERRKEIAEATRVGREGR